MTSYINGKSERRFGGVHRRLSGAALLVAQLALLQGCQSSAVPSATCCDVTQSSATQTIEGSRSSAPTDGINSKGSASALMEKKNFQNNNAISGKNASTLKGTLSIAIARSPEVKAAKASSEQSRLSISVARSGYMPTLQSSAGVGVDNEYDYQVTLSQPVYDFGRTKSKVGEAQAASEAADEKVRSAREQIALQAARAFISIKRYQALLDAAKTNISVRERFVTLANARAQGGISDASEQQLAQVQLSEARSAYEDVDGRLNAAKTDYNSLTGSEPGALAEVEKLHLEALLSNKELDDLISKAPSIKIAKAQKEQAVQSIEAEKAGLFPTLTVDGHYKQSDHTSDSKTGIGLRLAGPTFNGLSNFYRLKALKLAASSQNWNSESARRELLLQINQFKTQVPTLLRQAKLLGDQSQKSVKLRALYENQFVIGKRDFNDLSGIQNDIFSLDNKGINSRYDAIETEYNAAGHLGILLELLHIEGVEI